MLDPRSGKVPGFGELPKVTELSPHVVRLLAPNGSAMTLDGTNTYLVGGDGGGCLVVDPGPASQLHLDQIEIEAAARGWSIGGVLLTHHHSDHSESAFQFAQKLNVEVYAHADSFRLRHYHHLSNSGDTVIAGVALDVVPTPGHSQDHLCFSLPDGTLLTGDHVLGRGTSVVAYPDGSLSDYLDSLDRIRVRDFTVLAPGHGPDIERELAQETILYYLGHRRERLDQILDFIGRFPGIDQEQLVDLIYTDLPTPMIRFAAAASTRAGLEYLIQAGDIHSDREELEKFRVVVGLDSDDL